MAEQSAVITGSSGAIGKALVAAFRDAGYHTIGIDNRDDVAAEHSAAQFIHSDLRDYVASNGDGAGLVERITRACDGRKLAVLVNNAAVQILQPADNLSAADYRASLDVNVVAPALLAGALYPLLGQSTGSIVNIGSIHASLTKPEFAAYATSKAALRGLTQSLAVEWGATVRCNLIEPAAVETAMLRAGFEANPQGMALLRQYHPSGRVGSASEVASLALFLASDAAGFINGGVFGIDGGIRHRLHDPD